MERERITISIKQKVLNMIDKTIDGVNIRNRSHAIETLVSDSLRLTETKNAVILIGGEDAIKQVPFVKNHLRLLSKKGFDKVFIAVGFLADKIKEKIGTDEEYGLKIKYLEKGEGSAGAILPLKNEFKTTFFVFNSVKNIKFDIDKISQYHKIYHPIATIASVDINDLDGLYIFEPEIFKLIPKDFSMLESDIIPALFESNKAIFYPLS